MDDFPSFPLVDETDHSIVMFCEAHFSGNFDEMVKYTQKKGKGVQQEFSLKRIKELAAIQRKTDEKISDLLLSEEEKEEISQAKERYLSLRECYEKDLVLPRLIADLILTEDETADKELEALMGYPQKEELEKSLLHLLSSEEYYNPLFPGYGRAPQFAVKAIGLLQLTSAIPQLFTEIGKHDFFMEEEILNALKNLGQPAKQWLMRRIQQKPITAENENAALALIHFEDEEVALLFQKLLSDKSLSSHSNLAEYLKIGSQFQK